MEVLGSRRARRPAPRHRPAPDRRHGVRREHPADAARPQGVRDRGRRARRCAARGSGGVAHRHRVATRRHRSPLDRATRGTRPECRGRRHVRGVAPGGDRARHPPADPDLPAVRERAARQGRAQRRRPPGAPRRVLLGLQRDRDRQPVRVGPARLLARRDRGARAEEPDGRLPVHEADVLERTGRRIGRDDPLLRRARTRARHRARTGGCSRSGSPKPRRRWCPNATT